MIEDHPRPCGEKASTLLLLRTYPGSPPPMRGKVVSAAVVVTVIRITPAHAGKSSFTSNPLKTP